MGLWPISGAIGWCPVNTDDQVGVELEANFLSHLLDRLPTKFGIGNGARPAHEGDAAVAELVQMEQRLFDGLVVIENDVGNVGSRAVGGDGDHRNGNVDLVNWRVE
jgi:hypothetical protein